MGNHNSTAASGGAHPTNRTVATDIQEGTLPRISGAVADHQEGSLAAPNVSKAKVELSSSNDQQGHVHRHGQKPSTFSQSTPHTQLQSHRRLLQSGSEGARSVDVDAAAPPQPAQWHPKGDSIDSLPSVGIQPPDNSDIESAVLVQRWLW